MTNQVHRLADYTPPAWRTVSVDLHFDIAEDLVQVTNTMKLERVQTGSNTDLVLDGDFFTFIALHIDGNEATPGQWRTAEKQLIVQNLPDVCTLTLRTAFNPHENRALEGFYADGDLLVTQCEAEGFRRITYFADRPDNMSVYTVTMEADAERFPLLLSNGECRKRETLFDGRQRVVWRDPFPKPSYLFAAAAGDLATVEGTFITGQGRAIKLFVHVPHGKEKRALFALECLRKAMAWDEERFGLECDLDTYQIVATDTFNAGAMENKGLNIFNSACVLADPESATDADFEAVDRVIAHEYFHNWTGNRVTCRDWFQLTLKEGLTVFRDAEYTADTRGADLARIRDVATLKAGQFAEDASPLAHPIRPEVYQEINNFYTATVYKKGAEVIRMIQTLSSKEAFRKGMDVYFDLYDGQAVTTEDFIRAMELGTGLDLTQFKRWYSQKGTPVLTVSNTFENGRYTLHVEQSNFGDAPLVIPVKFGLLDPESGAETASGVLVLKEARQNFSFETSGEKAPVPSLLRGFSAPVILRYAWTVEQLCFIAVHDADLFCAYEALQTLMKEAILNPQSAFAEAARTAWSRQFESFDGRDPGYWALALNPPPLSILAAACEKIDYPELHARRQAFIRDCTRNNAAAILEKLDALKVREPYAPEPGQVSRRSCRALLFRFAASAGLIDLSAAYREVSNMSETLPLLSLLANTESGNVPLAAFRERWKDDALVICKYFAVQAFADRPDVMEKIEALEKDDCFDLNNPNKVNALYGSFIANAAHFHAADGKAYPFITARILKIDAFNPQLSASLAKRAFSIGARLCEPQRAKALQALRLLAGEKISVNLKEIVETLLN